MYIVYETCKKSEDSKENYPNLLYYLDLFSRELQWEVLLGLRLPFGLELVPIP